MKQTIETSSTSTLAVKAALALVGAYRVVASPFLGGTCRFTPSCSEYASQALLRHGVWRGSRLALGRLSRCHPLGPFGHDPVPEQAESPSR